MTTSSPEEVRPVLLVSATDSSGAAGMAVDIRVAGLCRVPCRLAVTAVTVQGGGGVLAVHPQPAALIAAAIATAFGDPPGVGSVKVGMLADSSVAGAVAEGLAPLALRGVPIVLDPVLRATSGRELLDPAGVDLLLARLLPLASLLTPNAAELRALARRLGCVGEDEGAMVRALLGSGARAVLVKGGEGEGPVARDTLYLAGAVLPFEHPRLPGPVPRGTGCALSTAIACTLALRDRGAGPCREVSASVEQGIALVQRLIAGSRMVGEDRLLFPAL
jgi:hydroxymethylpyrimidine/phosphomethylpyrimidine kinase